MLWPFLSSIPVDDVCYFGNVCNVVVFFRRGSEINTYPTFKVNDTENEFRIFNL